MSFEISCHLDLSSSASEYHRMVQSTQTYKWMEGRMEGRLSPFDGLLRAPYGANKINKLHVR